MKIVKPYAKILAPWTFGSMGISLEEEALDMDAVRDTGIEALSLIEFCARISHGAEGAQTKDSWKRFIQAVVMEHSDWSVVEHVSVSVDFLIDRGISHELVRHRLFSYTQSSTRFINYAKKMPPSFIYPYSDVECEHCLSGNEVLWTIEHDPNSLSGRKHMARHIDKEGKSTLNCIYDMEWLRGIECSEVQYRALLEKKWRPQEARSVFPNALSTRIVTTGNLRNWRHFLIMRTSAETHPQMRQVTIPLLKQFQDTFPILFDDITPMQKQSEAQKKAR